MLAIVAFLLVMSLLSAGPAAAHNFTKTDRDDTRGLLDLRSASVAHRSNMVVHYPPDVRCLEALGSRYELVRVHRRDR